MAVVTIGGSEYDTGEMRFKALKKAWPFIRTAKETEDPLDSFVAAINIVAVSLSSTHPEMTVEEIEEKLIVKEVPPLVALVSQILEESGLSVKKSGGVEGNVESPLTGTSAPTLQPS